MLKRVKLIFLSRYWESKKNIKLFNEVYFKFSEKTKRFVHSLIFAEQPKFLYEVQKSFGKKNKDKKFFVIRLSIGGGVFSNYVNALYMIYYARQNQLEPIIDYENYPSYQRERHRINNTKNSWEYFFEQPTEFELSEVYKSNKVILSANNSRLYFDQLDLKYFYDKEVLKETNQLKILNNMSKLVKYNSNTKKFIEKNLDSLFSEKEKILGIAVRGTDYNIKNFGTNHHKPFSLDEALNKAQSLLSTESSFTKIFVCTEEQIIIDSFKKEFGNRLIYIERPRHTKKSYDITKNVMSQSSNRINNRYFSSLEYIAEVEGLLRCDYVIGTFTNAMYYISIKNTQLNKKIEVFDYGKN